MPTKSAYIQKPMSMMNDISYRLRDFFILLLPSRDNKMDIGTSFALCDIARRLDKYIIRINTDKIGVSAARTAIIANLRDTLDSLKVPHGPTVKAMWFDDDVRILDDPSVIVKGIREADANGWNLLANYHNTWEGDKYINTLARLNAEGSYDFFLDSEIAALEPYAELRDTIGGLGCYYGDVPLSYQFHFDKYGEDINYFRDIAMPLRYWKLDLRHDKRVWI